MLKYQEIIRIRESKPFINEYNWEGIHFWLEKNEWRKIEKNNVTIALNVLYGKKEKNISCLCFKTQLKPSKTSYLFNDFKQRNTRTVGDLSYSSYVRRRMTLSCSIKTIRTIKRKCIKKKKRWFLLSELSFLLFVI